MKSCFLYGVDPICPAKEAQGKLSKALEHICIPGLIAILYNPSAFSFQDEGGEARLVHHLLTSSVRYNSAKCMLAKKLDEEAKGVLAGNSGGCSPTD